MMRNLGFSILLLLLAASPVSAAEGSDALPVYSIQVRAVPLAEAEDGMTTYRDLRDKGYLAYAYRADVNGAPWVRIAVGAFRSLGAAAEFGRVFSAAEGMDHFVAAAPVLILPGAGERDFVVTPSALWVRGNDGAREVYVFDFPYEAPNRAGLPAATLPGLSPGGEAMAFVYNTSLHIAAPDGRITGVGLDHLTPYVWADPDYPWRPGWSASGDYVAFLDHPFWENSISLWVVRADGEGLECLVWNRGDESAVQSAVKSFVWHPSEDRVLFVEGLSDGTGAAGGRLFSAEMDGTLTEITAVERVGDDEIAGPLRIEDGHLHYRRVRWLDEQKLEKTITDESIPVDAL